MHTDPMGPDTLIGLHSFEPTRPNVPARAGSRKRHHSVCQGPMVPVEESVDARWVNGLSRSPAGELDRCD